MSLKKWSILFLFIALAIGGVFLSAYERRGVVLAPLSLPPSLPEPQPFSPGEETASTEPLTPQEIPEKLLLQVPFTAQAPTGNWDELHNEACEETSAIMAAAYFSGDTRKVLPAPEVEKQLATLTDWQEKRFGYSLDTTAAETAEMIREVYRLNADIVTDYTSEDLREALAAGKVIIVPINGRLLGNPYFRQPGPIYHMIVIRGYTKTELITNDPGTRNGENYRYSFATIKNAAADWNHDTDTIDTIKPLMIVVSKNP